MFFAEGGGREASFARLRSCHYLGNAVFGDSEQVVCGTGNGRHLGLRSAYETGSSQPAGGLQQTEDLADAPSRSLANPVALGPGGSPIEAKGLWILGARDVKSYIVLAQVPGEYRHVIAFVGAERLGVNVAA